MSPSNACGSRLGSSPYLEKIADSLRGAACGIESVAKEISGCVDDPLQPRISVDPQSDPVSKGVIPNPEYAEMKGVCGGVMGSDQQLPLNEDPDARRWAREFVETAIGMLNRGGDPRKMLRDEAWLTVWFASAMMAIVDHLQRRQVVLCEREEAKKLSERLGEVISERYRFQEDNRDLARQRDKAMMDLTVQRAVLNRAEMVINRGEIPVSDGSSFMSVLIELCKQRSRLIDQASKREDRLAKVCEIVESGDAVQGALALKQSLESCQSASAENMRQFMKLSKELGQARVSNQNLGCKLERTEQQCGQLSLQVSDLEMRMKEMDRCFLSACQDRDEWRTKAMELEIPSTKA